MTRTSLLSGTAIAVALAATANAQDIVLLDEIVASASLVPVVAGETGATVDALEGDDIETGDAWVAFEIDRLPGTSFSSNGGLGQIGSIRVRGLNDFYLATRIDGIDVSDPSYGQPLLDFGAVTKAGIGRVELLKGSQSALYGSQAIAGVIDIETWKASEPGTTWRAQIEAGSNETYVASFGIATRNDRGGLAFNLSRTQSEGISAAASGTERDGFEETLVTVSGDFAAGESVTLGFSALMSDSTTEYDGISFVTFLPEDADLVNDNLRRGGRVYATILGAGVEHELSLSAYATTRDYPGGFVPRFEGDRLTLGYTGTWQRDVGTLVLGAEHVRETAEIAGFSGYVGKTERNSIYGEVLIERGAFDVSLASRLDHSEDFGTNSSNRIALAYDVSPDLTLKTVLGTGFRAPSLDERFASYGNPGLEVEKSESVEFGLVRRFASGAALEVVAYYTEIDNRIEFDGSSVACASGFGCFEQSDTATFSRGVEVALEAPLSDAIDAFASYTYTDASRSGARLAKVPLHDLVLGVEAEVAPGLTVSGDLTHVAGKPSLPDYTLLGAGLSYAVSENATAYLRVDNISDEDYQTSLGYNMPGRTWTVGLSAEF